MNILLLFIDIIYAPVVLSAILSTPGLYRTYLGSTAYLQWTVTGTDANNYTVYSVSNGNYLKFQFFQGTVFLKIDYVRLLDAGNYSITEIQGSSSQTDSTALLFVSKTNTRVNQTAPQGTATEGDTVELTCTVNVLSQPATYRTKIYYSWYLSQYVLFKNVTNGSAIGDNGDVISGYTFKNDGRTLVITAANYRYIAYYCLGTEDGVLSGFYDYQWFNLPLYYRPYISSSSGALFPVISTQVNLYINYNSNPLASVSNWTFIDANGITKHLPPDGSSSYYSYGASFALNFTSTDYFGNYTITASNRLGTATSVVQLLPRGPSGPPDPPSNILIYSPGSVVIVQWNCMWFNGAQQTVFFKLKDTDNNKQIATLNNTLYTECFNSTYTNQFPNDIQPETNYEVSVASINAFGSSNVQKIGIKTPKIVKLLVSCQTISINGNQAIINFSTDNGDNVNFLQLSVTIRGELTGSAQSCSLLVNNNTNRIVCNNIPDASVYIFNFDLYGGILNIYNYILASKYGVRVPRTGNVDRCESETSPSDVNSVGFRIAVIVLAVLLGVALLVLIGILVAFLLRKYRGKSQKSTTTTPIDVQVRGKVRDTQMPPKTSPVGELTYEPMDFANRQSQDDTYYTSIN